MCMSVTSGKKRKYTKMIFKAVGFRPHATDHDNIVSSKKQSKDALAEDEGAVMRRKPYGSVSSYLGSLVLTC